MAILCSYNDGQEDKWTNGLEIKGLLEKKEMGERGFMSLNPIFNDQEETKRNHLKKRKTRSDKTKDIKIPVTTEQKAKIKRLAKADQRKMNIQTSATKMATNLLLEGLNRLDEMVNVTYEDTKNYVHVSPTLIKYEKIEELAILLDTSERKIAHMIVINVLNRKEVEDDWL